MGTKALERKDASLAEKALAAQRATIYLTTSMLVFLLVLAGWPRSWQAPSRSIECLGVAVDAGLTIGLAQLSLATSALSYGALKFLKKKDTPCARSCKRECYIDGTEAQVRL